MQANQSVNDISQSNLTSLQMMPTSFLKWWISWLKNREERLRSLRNQTTSMTGTTLLTSKTTRGSNRMRWIKSLDRPKLSRSTWRLTELSMTSLAKLCSYPFSLWAVADLFSFLQSMSKQLKSRTRSSRRSMWLTRSATRRAFVRKIRSLTKTSKKEVETNNKQG